MIDFTILKKFFKKNLIEDFTNQCYQIDSNVFDKFINYILLNSFFFEDKREYQYLSRAPKVFLLLPNVQHIVDISKIDKNKILIFDDTFDVTPEGLCFYSGSKKLGVPFEPEVFTTNFIKLNHLAVLSDKKDFFHFFYTNGEWVFRGARALLAKLIFGKDTRDGGAVARELNRLVERA